ncbi:MAG TPA: hypothetical protein IAA62_02110 [Candidatus Caccopulliclostridium gallistercoris]|uniref:Lipoprotein n=1 Tax=Candidatus Caccopulliclostridium gallistercoris TaxID=2840719 RepID=A0A9D1NDW3_9FIRM|nr:hypothetical protein [Candidatus Caccopulliclostridium gallistercoris]
MKKLFSGILVCFLVAVSFLTTGCFNLPGGDDTGNLLYPSGTISGYKVCYKPTQYNFERLFLTFSDNIVSNLFTYFTFYNYRFDDENNFPGVSEDNYLTIWDEALNLDRVRYQPKFVNDEDGVQYYTYDNVGWNWSFGDNIEFLINPLISSGTNGKLEKNKNILEDFLARIAEYNIYYLNDIISIYSTVLEYNIYELVLGRTPTAPVIEISDTATTVLESVKVTLNSQIVDGTTTTRDTIMDPIQEEFSLYGTYVGFSERDRENLTNYILETVIGDQIVNNPTYNKNNEYQTKVAEIIENANPTSNQDVEEGQEPPRDFFDPYPASKIKDFNGTAFYINGGIDENGNLSNTNAFDHIQSAEYQSFVIMPEQEDLSLCALWLAFESEQPIDAVIRVRYYNGAGRLFETAKQQISMSGDPFDATTDIVMMDLVYNEISDTELDTEVDMILDPFDNELDGGILKADDIDGKYVTGTLAHYYNIIESDSGFGAIGVLNHNRIPFSYMEIVIDVIKDPNEPQATYPFKMGVVGIFPTAE